MLNIQFKPSTLVVLTTVMVVAILVSLGQWQLERADEKRAILEQSKQNLQQPATLLPDTLDDLESWRYRKVYFEGTPLHTRQFLLDNQVRNGRAGFNVLTIFKLNQHQHILVDRGWIPIKTTRDKLPDVSIPPQPLRIEGYLYIPYGEPFKVNKDIEITGWPRIIAYLDFAEISRHSDTIFPAFILRMDKDMPAGYQRDWPLAALSPDKHLGYAVQWFALAATVFGIFLVLNIKRKS